MDLRPNETSLRRERRLSRLGPDPCCELCGCRDPECLTLVRRGLLVGHHRYGWRNDPRAIVLVCLNCHRILHEGLLQEGASVERFEPDTIKRLVMMHHADAALFEDLAAARLRQFGLLCEVKLSQARRRDGQQILILVLQALALLLESLQFRTLEERARLQARILGGEE